MKFLVALASLSLALAARPVDASTCVLGPYVMSLEPAADCPLVFWRTADSTDPEPPRAHVYRQGVLVDVTETTTLASTTELDYPIYTLDCHDTILDEQYAVATMNVFHIQIANVEVGDELYIGNVPAGIVQPTGGSCALDALPNPYCVATYHQDACEPGSDEIGPENDNTAGCSATSGESSVFVGFALALGYGLARRRRRN